MILVPKASKPSSKFASWRIRTGEYTNMNGIMKPAKVRRNPAQAVLAGSAPAIPAAV